MIGDECRGVGWWASAPGPLSTAVTAGSGRRGGGAWSLARAAGPSDGGFLDCGSVGLWVFLWVSGTLAGAIRRAMSSKVQRRQAGALHGRWRRGGGGGGSEVEGYRGRRSEARSSALVWCLVLGCLVLPTCIG